MNYLELSDTVRLTFEQTKIAVFEEAKHLFSDDPLLLTMWQQDAYMTTRQEEVDLQLAPLVSESFRALFTLIIDDLISFKFKTKKLIRSAVENFADTIIQEMQPYMGLQEAVDFSVPVHDRDYIYANSSTTFHLMRDMVTKKNGFEEKDTGYLGTELIDNQGQLHGFAELRPIPLTAKPDEDPLSMDLVATTLSSLDELTADIFDLVSYLWMTGKRDEEGFIEFHSDDALLLRHYEKGETPEKVKFKERERFNIMRRVAALTSVWVSLNNGSERVKILSAQSIDSKLYNFQDFKRMFEVGSVRMAFDKRSNTPRGIYALQIRPSSLLQPYLDGTKSSLGVLDLKVFKYSYVSQREHKRLTRYLSRQWKIRTIKGTIYQPFKIATLLHEMDFPARLNGVQIRDRFEEVLDDLQRDEVIQSWAYSEPLDENRVGKKGWIQNYWTQLSITIAPPSAVIQENRRRITLPHTSTLTTDLLEISDYEDTDFSEPPTAFQQTALVLEEQPVETQKEKTLAVVIDTPLTPEILREKIDTLNYSIRKAAEEMGMSHTTLSRYLNRKIKRQNKDNDQKMLQWLQRYT
ncbi:helix-turn-helix domain-containing protein [Caryophanon tenue]|uniref:HTH cro/C1-type domain-containing protein n=1 Tax=Caryophanon tenue TaxID=33978 RepID=A0A1C0YIV9_9BACL|nr:helix-turn-helix transcriptional regulator [Caryophanon tenue]OCS87108.1 hypothetical protein A6M13_11575 [Caryophanon tenue]